MHTVRPGIWEKKQSKTWKLNTHTLQVQEYGEKTEKLGKWETHTVKPGIWWETLKSVQNEKWTLYVLEYVEKSENCGKWDRNTVWPGIWWENLKIVENENCTL